MNIEPEQPTTDDDGIDLGLPLDAVVRDATTNPTPKGGGMNPSIDTEADYCGAADCHNPTTPASGHQRCAEHGMTTAPTPPEVLMRETQLAYERGRDAERARIERIIDKVYAFRPKADQRMKADLLTAIYGGDDD